MLKQILKRNILMIATAKMKSVLRARKNIKEHFELEAMCLIAQVRISCNTFHEQVLSALWNTFNYKISLFVDKKGPLARYLKEDPEKRIKWFFSKVECDIDFDMRKCEWEEVGLRIFKKLYQWSQLQLELTPVQESIPKILQETKPRHKYLGAEKWRALRQQNKIIVETQTEIEIYKIGERGIRTSNIGTILFGAAWNLFHKYIPELNIYESKQERVRHKIQNGTCCVEKRINFKC